MCGLTYQPQTNPKLLVNNFGLNFQEFAMNNSILVDFSDEGPYIS